ncbi:retinol dehydrogenase 12 [Trichonephila inaurata madagascariensis]|uniref:Retinol dehydrogenase 12 n=1 Tax=Trichonephila inaurata madagascariensis TaxID=2747483 RepID=A0A8X6M993_9ARAC|nr:retinol dehydrogenase 12 [Trichonephila inaurata madagascariensis]
MANLDINDMKNDRKLSNFSIYAISKLCNILFSKELARRLSGTGKWGGLQEYLLLRTIEEGAQTTIHLAVAPELEKITGKYFSDCKEKAVKGPANDITLAKSLFKISEEITGVTFSKT